MAIRKNVVSAREHYPWELEFPSMKAAKVAEAALVQRGIDCYREDELLFVKWSSLQVSLILEEIGFDCKWLTLEEQSCSGEIGSPSE